MFGPYFVIMQYLVSFLVLRKRGLVALLSVYFNASFILQGFLKVSWSPYI